MIAHLFTSLMPVVALFATVTLLVLRAGASRIFFDVVGSFQATRLIGDAQAKITVLQGLVLDGLSGITEGVGLIGEQMQQLVDSTVPLSKEIGFARIEFEKFANFADSQEIGDRIIEIGETYGFAADQALAAGAKMAQLSQIVGGGEATGVATEVGIQFGLIGGMETEDAMKKLISLQQQTKFMYGDLTKAQFDRLSTQEKANLVGYESVKMLNQLNTIENRSSATMAQMTHVMNQFASSARLAGDETSFMAAASATLIEAGEEQGKAGRALKMIYARLGADTGNNSKILRKFGVETKNANGSLRSLEEILTDLSTIYPTLSNDQQLQISQAMAGNDHYVRAIKLMEGFNRTMQLQTDAVNELDTAQAELNKRFKETAFQLTHQEARLKNSKAAIGDLLAPAVVKATKAQADLNFALAEMAETSPEIRAMMDGLFTIQQFGKMYAPLVEANLNMMSLTVSLQTQVQIQRALAGQDLVRASAYGGQAAQLRTNLGLINEQATAESKKAMILASQLSFNKSYGAEQEHITFMSNLELTNNVGLFRKKQQLHMLEVQRLTTKQRQMKATSLEISLEQGNLQVLIDKNKTAQHTTQIHIDELKQQAQLGRVKRNIATNERTLVTLKERGLVLAGLLTKEEQKALELARQGVQYESEQMQAEGMAILMTMAHTDAVHGTTEAHKILGAAKVELTTITAGLSNTETQNVAIMEVAERVARELAIAYQMDEQVLRQLIPTLGMFTGSLDKVAQKSEQTVNSAMMLNMRMMQLSGTLGAMSMGFSMFRDDAKAARASMILMNFAMIPMTIQMFTMTKASMGLMGGMAGATTATNGLTAAFAKLHIVSKTTIVLGTLAAVMGAIYYLMPNVKDEFDMATLSINDMNKAVSYTQESYQALAEELSVYSTPQGVMGYAYRTQLEINDILDNRITTEGVLKTAQDEKLAGLREELAISQDIQTVKTLQLLQDQQIMGEGIYDRIKAAQAEEDAATAAQNAFDARGVFSEENFFHRYSQGAQYLSTLGGNFGEGTKGAGMTGPQDDIDAMAASAAEAFKQIPEQYRGAIEEMAKSSATFEEFMNKVDEALKDTGIVNPFKQLGNDIEENFVGPIEAAKEAAFEFSNAREEMFFGMSKGNITGDMVKQVVNKGVETLINTTEVIMTNNFTGMTTTQAANEITKQVVENLNGLGLNIPNA
ncbi:phage tail tape measure protein [bacterium]|nr:phage tail tape measure protein [bacterium]